MFHSRFVACRLGIWTEGGRKKLQLFLAKIGLPMDDAKQPWTHLSGPVKTALKEKIADYAGQYGMQDLTFPSFTRVRIARAF